MKAKNVLLLAVVATIVTFLVQNSEQTAVKFLFWSPSLPRWALLGGLIFLGFFAGWIFGALRCRKKEQAKAQAVEKEEPEEKEVVK